MRKLFKNKSGATTTEYGLISASIAIMVSLSVYNAGEATKDSFCKGVQAASASAAPSTDPPCQPPSRVLYT